LYRKAKNIQIYIKTDRETDRPADWLPTDRYIGRQAGQQVGRQKIQTDRQTDKQTDRQTERQKDSLRNIYQYCIVLFLYSKYSIYVLYPHMVLNTLYYNGGGWGG
jgi:hypothetical protein